MHALVDEGREATADIIHVLSEGVHHGVHHVNLIVHHQHHAHGHLCVLSGCVVRQRLRHVLADHGHGQLLRCVQHLQDLGRVLVSDCGVFHDHAHHVAEAIRGLICKDVLEHHPPGATDVLGVGARDEPRGDLVGRVLEHGQKQVCKVLAQAMVLTNLFRKLCRVLGELLWVGSQHVVDPIVQKLGDCQTQLISWGTLLQQRAVDAAQQARHLVLGERDKVVAGLLNVVLELDEAAHKVVVPEGVHHRGQGLDDAAGVERGDLGVAKHVLHSLLPQVLVHLTRDLTDHVHPPGGGKGRD
mmetsp:Transcript_19457/g.61749  ORF Transcript_19457/g.61749 Transcript_19457/m.61749 type:complete len:299 (-) Transcript_19457:233-1129(-)